MLFLVLLRLTASAQQCPDLDYSQGGANWGGVCNSGTMQSPIDLGLTTAQNFPHYLFLTYPQFPVLATIDCPNFYSLSFPPVGELIVKDSTLQSFPYHTGAVFFHSPSEHTLLGNYQDLEVQIRFDLFPSGSERFAVLSILFNSDADPEGNPFFEQLIGENGALVSNVDTVTLEGVVSQWTAFSPYYYYEGSMTIPPCTEGFNWYVLATPQRLSTAQLKAFRTLQNNRKTQSLNTRTLYANSGGVRHNSS